METISKGKRKHSSPEAPSPDVTKMQEQLEEQQRIIERHEAENARRDSEQQANVDRISEMEKMIASMKKSTEPVTEP